MSQKTEKSIPAHAFLLAIASPVFYAMFYGAMTGEKRVHSIEIPDIDLTVFQVFLR